MASGSARKTIKVRVEYEDTPPQIFVSELNTFIRDHQPPSGFKAEITWQRVVSEAVLQEEEQQQRRPRDVPLGYKVVAEAPLRKGPNYCKDCLCSPCIIQKPPDFLRGSCDPHPANAEKRYDLYRKFWRCLNTMGVWQEEEYLQRKELRTVRDDRRDIMPDCVILEIRRRYPSHDGQYRDYMTTFDACIDYDYDYSYVDDDNSMS